MRIGTCAVLVFTVLAGVAAAGFASGDDGFVLDLDTLEARFDGTTFHATELAGAHVGAIDEDLFVAVLVGDATEEEGPRSVRGYVCDREVGVWLDGEVDGDDVTLSSEDGVVQIEGTISGDDVFGTANLGEAEPRLFTAALARGDAGPFRAEASLDGVDRTAGWIVLEDGRQRGSPLDGKGNDVCPCEPL